MIVESLLLAAIASSDHGAHAAPSTSQPVPLFDNLGSYHRKISTKNRMAQKYFDQGLRLTYGFNHDEAERAFREAVRLDPSCAICHWGIALVLGPNINMPMDPSRNAQAVEALSRAKATAGGTGAERALIDALAARYSADPDADRVKLDEAYAAAMKDAHNRFPKDDDIATMYAEAMMDLRPWKFWSPDGTPAPGTEQIVATLELVLKRNRKHPGANHYYIHATEASKNPGRAKDAAKQLETLIPGAGHLVHMPAHVYMRTGNYAGASEANAKAAAIDEKYIKEHNVQGVYPVMYYTHNVQFLAAAAAMEGRSAVSIDSARRATQLAAPLVKEMPMAEFVVPFEMYALLRFEKWDEVLALPKPDEGMRTTVALWYYGRAVAYTSKGMLEKAASEKAAFDDATAQVPPDAMMNLNASKDLLAVAAASLDARFKEAKKDSGAIDSWTAAVAAEDVLAYDEPPAWFYPVRESLGGAYLRAGRADQAERVFREDLERNPESGRSLFGLAEALKAQKKEAEAKEIATRFKKAWARADVTPTVAGL